NVLGNNTYWMYSSIMILGYVIFMGLRYGRLVDYEVYKRIWDSVQWGYHEGFEPLFASVMFLFKKSSLSYELFIAFTSFLFIFSFFLYIKDRPSIIVVAPILLLFECAMAENFIKWYVSFSFVLIGLYFYKKKQVITASIFAILSCFLHYGMSIVVIPIIILLFINKLLLNNVVCLLIYVFVSFYGSTDILNIFEPLMPYLGFNEKILVYAQQYNDIVNGQFGVLGFTEKKGFFEIIRNVVAYGIPILYAPMLVKQKCLPVFEVNAFFIGLIIDPIFTQVELLGRISGCFHFFSIFVCASVYLAIIKKQITMPSYYRLASMCGFAFLLWHTFRYCLATGRESVEDLRFIWDVNSIFS
ncbi:MAG: EpsG family protein, partial [Floccifex sp.]